MIIGVDGNEANVDNRVGVSVYTLELLNYFQKYATDETRFVVYLRHNPGENLPEETQFFKYEVVTGPGLWRDIFLPLKLYSSHRPDVFFSPAHYTPRFSPVPVVVTIHDVAYEYYPQEFLKKDLFKLKNWTKHAVSQAHKIISVSENTKKDIVKFYKVPDKKISVIYNGFNKYETRNLHLEKEKSSVELQASSYILYVGTIQPRKNIETLIEAFALLKKEKPELKLVIAGKKGWLYEKIFQKVIDLQLEFDVIFTGFVPDDEIAGLYKHAKCFVMPSLYEGFGLPILEAMSHDCPVTASNTSSLPEIGGDACLYFDPHDTIDLSDQVKAILENKDLRAELIKQGKERIKRFSWEKCGRETLELLRSTKSSS